MGLDMYLMAKMDSFEREEGEELKRRKKLLEAIPEITPVDVGWVKLSVEVGYWRKANQIHNWFVRNVQDGKDDCNSYPVERDDLEELLRVCNAVLKQPKSAKELLPTQGGLFFGGTDYGLDYKAQLKDTVRIIKNCLKLPEEWDFEYQSSW